MYIHTSFFTYDYGYHLHYFDVYFYILDFFPMDSLPKIVSPNKKTGRSKHPTVLVIQLSRSTVVMIQVETLRCLIGKKHNIP